MGGNALRNDEFLADDLQLYEVDAGSRTQNLERVISTIVWSIFSRLQKNGNPLRISDVRRIVDVCAESTLSNKILDAGFIDPESEELLMSEAQADVEGETLYLRSQMPMLARSDARLSNENPRSVRSVEPLQAISATELMDADRTDLENSPSFISGMEKLNVVVEKFAQGKVTVNGVSWNNDALDEFEFRSRVTTAYSKENDEESAPINLQMFARNNALESHRFTVPVYITKIAWSRLSSQEQLSILAASAAHSIENTVDYDQLVAMQNLYNEDVKRIQSKQRRKSVSIGMRPSVIA